MARSTTRRLLPLLAAALLAGAVAPCNPATAQSQAQPTDPLPAQAGPAASEELTSAEQPRWPTTEVVRAYLAEVEAQTELQQATREELTGHYRAALADLEAAAQARSQTDAFNEDRIAAPQRLTDIRTELAALQADNGTADLTGSLSELETRLSNLREEFESWRTRRESLASDSSSRTERMTTLPGLIAAKREELRAIEAPSTPPSPDSMTPGFARQVAAAARRLRVDAELRLLEAEQSSYTARAELLTARRERADRMVSRLTRQVDTLQQEVTRLRTLAAQEQAEQARTDAETLPRSLADEARRNAELSERRAEIQQRIGRIRERSDQAQRTLSEVRARFDAAQQRVEQGVDSGPWIGLQLRNELNKLPDLREKRQERRRMRGEIATLRQALFELEDQLFSITADVEATRDAWIAGATMRTDWLATAAQDVLDRRLESLRSLTGAYEDLINVQVVLDTRLREIIDETERFAAFIDERILWVRSDEPMGADTPAQIIRGVNRLAAPETWRGFGPALTAELRTRPVRHISLALLSLALLLATPRLRMQIRALIERVGQSQARQMGDTLGAVLIQALSAASIPVALAVVGQFFGAFETDWALAPSIAQSCYALAVLLFVVSFLRGIERSGGVGDRHFRWPKPARQRVIRTLRWWTPIAATFLAGRFFFSAAPATMNFGELTRISLILWLLALMWPAVRLLGRESPLMSAFWHGVRGGWMYRGWSLIHAITVITPLALAVAAGLGYTYTAGKLEARISLSVGLLIGVVVLRALIRRWLVLERRRLALERARAEQSAATDQAEASETKPFIEQETLDVSSIGEQTARLIRVALVLITAAALIFVWLDTIPALGILDTIQLHLFGLTLGDVVAALIIAVLTTIAARNAPGLLEITLLHRLPIDAGGRYAVVSLFRYLIVLIGVVLGGAALGMTWTSIQWLAAAATVGLGFGLQEIFANFVSGLIILFERPIRIGDTVTVNQLTGTITKIRIRATTILDWDRKEIIIPNKEFITGQLVNWTLTDSVLRVIQNVGVAYGSNTELVEQLLYKAAKDNPGVLEDPAPQVYFRGFGDNALEFELRVFLPDLKNFVVTRHSLNSAIDREFRAHGVEIAFPQRDLHIRTMPAAMAAAMERHHAEPPKSIAGSSTED